MLGIFLKYYFHLIKKKNVSNTEREIERSIIYTILVLGVIKEELKYRLLLTKFNINFFFFSLSLFITDIIFLFFRDFKFSFFDNLAVIINYYLCLFLCAFILFLIVRRLFEKFFFKIEKIFKKYTLIILLGSVLSFSLWHVFFTDQTNTYSFLTVFLIHTINAVFYSYVRIKFGIIYSILFHLGYNLFIYYPLLL